MQITHPHQSPGRADLGLERFLATAAVLGLTGLSAIAAIIALELLFLRF